MTRKTRWLGSLGLALLGVAAACDTDPLVSHGTSSASTGTGQQCVQPGDTCGVTFVYPLGDAKSVELRGDFAPDGWDVGRPLSIDAGSWRVTIDAPDQSTIHYKFFVDGANYVPDPNNPDQEDDGFGAKNSVKHVSCGVACGTGGAGGAPPGAFDWRSAVMYFVFVDRFANGDPSNDGPVAGIEQPANYQGGDYQGLLDKINAGYFDDLGVNALWLTVPMDNPNVAGPGADGHAYSAYHGYWPQNLDQVEEHFGSLTLLQSVVSAAHAKGIKVLFDYAMNHVHITSPVYAQHPDWFWPLDFDGKHCVCGDGCGWDGYDGRRCWFRDYLPDWNFQNPEARKASIDNAMSWIEKTGIDGFRLDAVKHIETVWISDLRKRLNEEVDQSKGRFYLVGETFDTGNRDFIRQYVSPDLLDGQFDFPLRGAIVDNILRRQGSMADLDGFLGSNDGYYDGIMSTFLGNHDIARVINTALDQPWGTWDNGGSSNWTNPPGAPSNKAPYERLALGFAFLLTTKGIPLIYYGDEIGMPGSGDPDNRRMMKFSGLGANEAWLKDQIGKLGKIRAAHPALWKGTRTKVSVTSDTYVYQMSSGADVLYVAMNRADLPHSVDGLPSSSTDLLTGAKISGPSYDLPARSVVILEP
ncbi:MAG: alpha-amylase family glycosyl hydrolase [Polyangiaceae bacterium]